jgi:hypothetical protein
MHPPIWRGLASFRQLDHVNGRRVSAFPARSAFQRGFQIGDRAGGGRRWPQRYAHKRKRPQRGGATEAVLLGAMPGGGPAGFIKSQIRAAFQRIQW